MVRYDLMVENKTETQMRINIGPQHPATHGTLRLIVDLDGERIKNVDQEIGFLHTGFEKIGEHLNYNQFVTVTDRMNYISPLNNNIGYAVAVEDMLGIEVPRRGQYLRMIMCELGRLADHILCVGLMGMDVGAWSPLLWCFVERERLYTIFEKITGVRFTTSWTRIGGAATDFPDGIEKEILQECDRIIDVLKEVEIMLTKNRIWLDRTIGIGIITCEQAIEWGVTGPIARASGVNFDLRQAKPYLCYDEVDFEVAQETDGDAFARYKLRLTEMRESVKIVKQAIDNLPEGEINNPDFKFRIPDKDATYNDMESLIHHFKMIMPGSGFFHEKQEVYSSTEVPNGELGFHIFSNGTDKPYKLHVRSPSLANFAIFKEIIKGHFVADIPTILATLNIIAGELDR